MKTGHTEAAGFNLVASAERHGLAVLAVALGAESETDRARSGRALLDYAFHTYEARLVQRAGNLVQVPVWFGEPDQVEAGLSEDLVVIVPTGSPAALTMQPRIRPDIEAPVARGQAIGTLVVRVGDRIAAERPIVALSEVSPGGPVKRMSDRIRLWFRGSSTGSNAAPP